MTSLKAATLFVTALTVSVGGTGAHEGHGEAESFVHRLQVPIPNLDGTEFTSAIVTFSAGAKAAPHRHGQAFVYAYVLSGTVRSQLDDQPAKVYRAGDEWYEPPGAHHKLTENASSTQTARLLVVFVAPRGTPLKVPD